MLESRKGTLVISREVKLVLDPRDRLKLDTGDETQGPEPQRGKLRRRGRKKKKQEASNYRPRERLGCGALELDPGCKGGSGQLKTTGCGQREVIEKVFMGEVIMEFELTLKGLARLD